MPGIIRPSDGIILFPGSKKGTIKIHYDLMSGKTKVDAAGTDLRVATQILLEAASTCVAELIKVTLGSKQQSEEDTNAKKKNDDSNDRGD